MPIEGEGGFAEQQAALAVAIGEVAPLVRKLIPTGSVKVGYKNLVPIVVVTPVTQRA